LLSLYSAKNNLQTIILYFNSPFFKKYSRTLHEFYQLPDVIQGGLMEGLLNAARNDIEEAYMMSRDSSIRSEMVTALTNFIGDNSESNENKLQLVMEKAVEILNSGKTIFESGLDYEPIRELFLLTAKPFLYVFNLDEDELTDDVLKKELSALVAPVEAVFMNAKLEAELGELPEEEALELLQSVGQQESGIAILSRVGFKTLGLQTYLTAGPKESRAWTIPVGATAPEAAGVIHTDFQKGFIKAEIVAFDDLVSAGSVAEAKSKGKVRMEGKEYVMSDGDVVEFRFNV
jgi:ribosome-binding ATPase YchF (GTP1/OBG family)